ncbi:hypothetical protein DFH11DRAFT_988952 [Phellopilus nigrolimitatus]|nr:hypothetical protein DFH11DRAFT_988952 [Phellopilus nigrolimitatus]
MVKKFRRKEYKKDVDDHFVVVINPWANGLKTPRKQEAIDMIGAWLRIAFRKPDEKGIIRAIFTLDTRDEVIAQINPCIDLKVGLGTHKWGLFLKLEELDRIAREFKVKLHDRVSHIYEYDWKANGDPGEHQWKEHTPRQDRIPDKIMVKKEYPEPSLLPLTSGDARLLSLILPLPREKVPIPTPPLEANQPTQPPKVMSDIKAEKRETDQNKPPGHSSSNQLDRVEVKNEDKKSHSKADKLDPYEEDAATQTAIHDSLTKGSEQLNDTPEEYTTVKEEEIKPHINDAEYRPSASLIMTISELQENSLEAEDRKLVVKTEDYQPSRALIDVFSQYPSSMSPNEGPSVLRRDSSSTEASSFKRSLEDDQGRSQMLERSAQVSKRVKREEE